MAADLMRQSKTIFARRLAAEAEMAAGLRGEAGAAGLGGEVDQDDTAPAVPHDAKEYGAGVRCVVGGEGGWGRGTPHTRTTPYLYSPARSPYDKVAALNLELTSQLAAQDAEIGHLTRQKYVLAVRVRTARDALAAATQAAADMRAELACLQANDNAVGWEWRCDKRGGGTRRASPQPPRT